MGAVGAYSSLSWLAYSAVGILACITAGVIVGAVTGKRGDGSNSVRSS